MPSLTPKNQTSVDRHNRILAEIREISAKRPDNSKPVKLVAVSKTFSPEHIEPILENGQRIFGENRVQEAEGKWPWFRKQYNDLQLHLIGPLQTNKVRKAVSLFDCIETIDRPKLARAVAKELEVTGKKPDLLIQVNTGGEAQKAGVELDDFENLLTLCNQELGLKIRGLMCIPPQGEEPSKHFSLLNDLATSHNLEWLSMGMSADFPLAIAHGATHVRVGSAIFGQR